MAAVLCNTIGYDTTRQNGRSLFLCLCDEASSQITIGGECVYQIWYGFVAFSITRRGGVRDDGEFSRSSQSFVRDQS